MGKHAGFFFGGWERLQLPMSTTMNSFKEANNWCLVTIQLSAMMLRVYQNRSLAVGRVGALHDAAHRNVARKRVVLCNLSITSLGA